MRTIKLSTISLEEFGEELIEIELEVYGKIIDFDEIKNKATRSEWQEQYEVRKDRGCIRARMVKTDDENPQYILTTKTWKEVRNERKEAEISITKDMFDHFKIIADSGMIKRRYFIDLGYVEEDTPNGVIRSPLEWEVDVFYDLEGKRQDWCKIDLEVPEKIDLPELPIQLENAITNQYGKRTSEEIAFLDQLFKEQFIVRPNK